MPASLDPTSSEVRHGPSWIPPPSVPPRTTVSHVAANPNTVPAVSTDNTLNHRGIVFPTRKKPSTQLGVCPLHAFGKGALPDAILIRRLVPAQPHSLGARIRGIAAACGSCR